MRIPFFAVLAIVAAILAFSASGSSIVSASSQGILIGDGDCNSVVNAADGLAALDHHAAIGTDSSCIDLADVNCDDVVDLADVIELLRYAASLPAGDIPQGCAEIGTAGGLPPLTVDVDPQIDVPAAIPPVDGQGASRPLDVLEDEEGNQTVYVANELIILTDDTNALNAFMAQWQGTLVKTINPHDYGMDIPRINLVHINPGGADTSQIADDLHKVNALTWGEFSASSQEAAELLAVAVGGAADGMKIDLNWVMENSSYQDRTIAESATGPSGWSSNPYNWTYMNRHSNQDIGVGDAWRALSIAGKLGNHPKISILDGGFTPNNDFPAGYEVVGSTGVPNPATCTGGSACPWHGTMVTAAAMGVPNNGYGVAGPGGPVAHAIITQSPSSDVLSYLEYIFIDLPLTALGGPDIINISAGSGIAREWCLTGICLAMDGIMHAVRAFDILVFAAAGNDGTNVDEQKCYDVVVTTICYEKTTWLPCELDEVICVGGLADNSKSHHSLSNYGTDTTNTVDIFGPFVQYKTPTPDSTSVTFGTCGTSCATPFVAGVAALVKAANPNLDSDSIEDVLMESAHDDSPDSRVPRWVNAYRAVIQALGGNEPPELHVNLGSGDTYGGIPLELTADVSDPEDRPTLADPYTGLPIVQWTSSLDGPIGNGPVVSGVLLSYGQHTITVTATDSRGAHLSETRNLNVINNTPTVKIVNPLNGAIFYEGQTIHLRGTSQDLNFPSSHLPDADVEWFKAPAASPASKTSLGHLHELTTTLTQGDWILSFTGTDDQNATQTKTVTVHVTEPPDDLPPEAEITGVDDTHICFSNPSEWVFTGKGTDVEDGDLSGGSLVWRLNGGTIIGTGKTVHFPTNQTPTGDFTITLTATDSNSGIGTDTRLLHFDGCIA